MQGKDGSLITKTVQIALVTLAVLAIATSADAQSREGRWEFTIGTNYQLSGEADFEGGSNIETDNEFGFTMTTGYHLSDQLMTNFGFQWTPVGYDATIVDEDNNTRGISGTYDAWALSANLILNLSDGPITPFLGAGIGYTLIDTNVPNGLPTTGCYWDPWWGYICYTDYPTKTSDAFSYQALAGLRWAFNPSTFLRLTYNSQWIQLSGAEGTPRFDTVALEVGWLF